MQWLLRFLQSAPPLPELTDPQEIKAKYKHWRIRIMYSIFVGYAFYYFTRKSFSFAMPGIMQDLHFEKAQLGIMGTLFALTYGLSKFFSGVLSDQSNPRYFMALGLMLTGLLNIFVGFSSSLWAFAIFWALNGWFQGFGWPPCVKLLSTWYSQSERGSWWSSWAVSQNVGGILTPWLVGFCLQYMGWRYAMFVPGVLCLLGSFFLLNRLSDVPQSLGLPPVEKYRDDYANKKESKEQETLNTRERILSVLRNKYIWLLAVAYFFIYFIRSGLDWTLLFMVEAKGYAPMEASGFCSLIEVGGLIGMLSAGWVSDRLFKAKRGPVNALFAMGLLASVIGFWLVPGGYAWLDSALLFMIGFSIFGPQMLIGVAVAEFAHRNATATATGLAGWIAYLGSATAGFPLGRLIDQFGWEGFFFPLILSALLACLLLIPFWIVSQAPSKAAPSEGLTLEEGDS